MKRLFLVSKLLTVAVLSVIFYDGLQYASSLIDTSAKKADTPTFNSLTSKEILSLGVEPKKLALSPMADSFSLISDLEEVSNGRLPRLEVETQKGINVIWYKSPNELATQTTKRADETIQYISDLNANSVMLSFPLYMDSYTSNKVFTTINTPSLSYIKYFVIKAKQSGIRVALRPLIDEKAFIVDKEWRGSLAPTSPALWFDSYFQTIRPYILLAEMENVEEFIIGAEFSSLSASSRWESIVAKTQSLFSGDISYSSNWDADTLTSSYDELDYDGIDAYFKIDLPDSASIAQLTNSWVNVLNDFNTVGRSTSKIVLHETGLPSQSNLYTSPWAWKEDLKAKPNFQTQINWFSAACNATEITDLAGLYWWKLDFNQNYSYDASDDATANFVNKPAEDVIKTCFTNL